MVRHYNIQIYGFVQGVGFRAWVRVNALQLDLTGFVQNLTDDSVYIEVEGEEVNLESFVSLVKTGPSLAQVERIDVSEGKLKGLKGFFVY